jgi:hypothetical protein
MPLVALIHEQGGGPKIRIEFEFLSVFSIKIRIGYLFFFSYKFVPIRRIGGRQSPLPIYGCTYDPSSKLALFFRKFIVPDSVVVGLNLENLPAKANLQGVAAVTPSGQKVIVLNNRDVSTNYSVTVYNSQGSWVNLNLEARSFTSIVFS